MTRECAFEPDAIAVLCVDCEKPTGLMGTCTDVDFCASCRTAFIEGSIAQGSTRQGAEQDFSAMMISLIEGLPYKAKYAPRRVLHVDADGRPACGVKGGPHPLTTKPDQSNCKRCVSREKKGKRD